MSQTNQNKVLDCKGDLCPMPVYKTSRALMAMAPGETLEVHCSDPGSQEDFPAFAKQTGHELIATSSRDGVFVFVFKKGAR